MEVRELLTELKARVITNRKFRLALEKIVKDQNQLESIMQELDRVAPITEGLSGGRVRRHDGDQKERQPKPRLS